MTNAWNYSCNSEGIAQLLLDVPGQKVNTLSSQVMQELDSQLDQIKQNKDLKALVITSAKKDNFIAGADVKEFTTIKDAPSALRMASDGQAVLNKLSELAIPSIAVIDGSCMGGGLELALACTYRIVSDDDKTLLALPEVNLGLIPGWGGTQRLTRLVGLMQGLEMILSGKTVPARKASKMGLADAIAPKAFLQEKTAEFTQECLNPTLKKKIIDKRCQSGVSNVLFEKNPLGRFLVYRKSEQTILDKTKGFYPAPIKALSVVKDTYGLPLKQGLAIEANAISSLFESSVARNLIRVFLMSQELKKNPGMTVEAAPREIKSVAVLGAGVMGGGIAWLFSKDNYPVRLKDINWPAIGSGLASAQSIYAQLVKIRKLKPSEVRVKMSKISGTTDYTGFKYTDLIIEAVVEDLKIKQKVLSELENHIAPDAIIASNTSALPISEMARSLKHPERFVGMHFFNPVNRMPLVEVIPGEKTSPEAVATAVAILKKLGKTPIVVADRPGFLVNRILLPYLNEAGWMLEQGLDYEMVDQVILEFGMPMGPFELLDEVGLDVALKAAKTIEKVFGNRAQVPKILQDMISTGLIGKKTNSGFYLHEGKKKKLNPKMLEFLKSQNKKAVKISNDEIVDRMMLGMANEATYCLQEKIVVNADALDLAMIMGMGFPAFRGGLLRFADQEGLDSVVNRLTELQKLYGERFTPSELLKQYQREKKNFTL